ncbi:LytTR family DNA-binding domain-containing protein [Flavobacterium sp. Root186]|uniref:LytR/AlgR family response regulator transcription factor n=1 Tax=Flavobacterium sp. Root186 TaxID=1736485 RepID=UPI0006F67D15|nr:LytTR family transcriptional regulator DNA-binding domain-containing protein [Flavobacterium sp. Root186]KRB54078.1 LytTR family transcriptional regulator [Flavobacterium sp. Root186]
MKKYSYIIVDNDAESVLKTRIVAEGFSELTFIASATNYHQGLNLVLEHRPSFVFLEIDPEDSPSHLSLSFIGELYRYLSIIPKIIVTTTKKELAFEAIQYSVFDYIIKPLTHIDLLKTLLKFEKTLLEPKETRSIETRSDIITANEIPVLKQEIIPVVIADQNTNQETYKPLVICIKSYGDHRYINADDICYFQADNNSTDIYLNSGDMVTAFKTLKHFEQVLSYPFIRIHNSYIINRNYIARIHNGNSVCYIKNSTKKIPFSKTYKANVDLIIADFSKGNYLEI